MPRDALPYVRLVMTAGVLSMKVLMRLFLLAAFVPVSLTGANAAASEAQIPPSLVAETYVLGAGDVLSIFVWRNPDLSVTVPVRPDGRITTPLVEDLSVAGKTTVQVAREIEAVLKEYVKSPQVNVIVSSAASVLNQVKVLGQVRTPKAVIFVDGMTVLDVVLAVGGLNEFASGNRAKVVRNENGKNVEVGVRLKDIQEGDLRTNIPVRAGDVLVVPQSLF
jgi:polysaccharide export outer membrane protein